MSKLMIELDNNDRGYYLEGEIIKGTVFVTLNSSATIRSLPLKATGSISTHWKKSTGNIKLFDSCINLIEGSSVRLSRGSHKFKFVFQLPSPLPASISLENGGIAYRFKAKLSVAYGRDDKFSVCYSVGRIDDLNLYPALKAPNQITEFKKLGLPRFLEPLTMICSTDRSAYVGGQNIYLTVNYDNKSGVQVVRTLIRLRKIHEFKGTDQSSEKSTSKEFNLVEIVQLGVQIDDTKIINCILPVPFGAPCSNGHLSKIVEIRYEIFVQAMTAGIRFNVDTVVPVIIGSIPFREADEEATVLDGFVPQVLEENFHYLSQPGFHPTEKMSVTSC